MRAIVTGAARGLGEGIAERLVADGWHVALIDRDDGVIDTAERLTAASTEAVALPITGDVSDADWVAQAVPEVIDRLGGLDLLVNNAGVGGASTAVADTPVEEFRRVLEVNLVGAFSMSKACAPALVRDGGSIVNLGSIYGQQGVAEGAPYSASKGGVALLTHSLALELAPHGVRVNTIAPGYMLTEMHLEGLRASAHERGGSLDDEVERVRATVPLGRHGTAQDVAGAVLWLASADASYVTGQTIGVNGGVLLT